MNGITTQLAVEAELLQDDAAALCVLYEKYFDIMVIRARELQRQADLAAQDFPHGQVPYRVRRAIWALLEPEGDGDE